jgi:hypothetical protein
MVGGHPSGAQRGHHTMEGCVAEWQEHCLLGVHPHPADPERGDTVRSPSPAPATTTVLTGTAPPTSAIRANAGPPRNRARRVDSSMQAQLYVQFHGGAEPVRITTAYHRQQFCMPDLARLTLGKEPEETAEDCEYMRSGSDSVSSVSSVTATTWAEVPVIARYFSLWGGRIVYSDR